MKMLLISLIGFLTISFVQSSNVYNAIYYPTSRSQLVFGSFINGSSRPDKAVIDCTVLTDLQIVYEVLSSLEDNDTFPVEEMALDTFNSLVSTCKTMQLISLLKPKWSIFGIPSSMLIAPGTKWCGPGNRSTGYDDLGTNYKTDACCRDHDYCPKYIDASETAYGLTNTAAYTSSYCDCDDQLKSCLKEASKNDIEAYFFGVVYFNVLKTQCFTEVESKDECLEYDGSTKSDGCVRYSNTESTEPVYEFKDAGRF